MDAVDDLSDAIDVTRDLLVPVRPWLWIKLAIVVLFVAGAGLGSVVPADPGVLTGPDEPLPQEPTDEEFVTEPALEELPIEELVVIGLIIAVVLVGLWLVFRLLSAIAEFVFIESLRSGDVHIRRYSRANLGRGLRLFVFRLGVAFLAALPVFGLLAAVFVTGDSPEAVLGSLLSIGLLGLVLGIIYGIVMRFTSEFVAPIMLLESRGVVSAWRRFFPTLAGNTGEYVVYVLLVWILQLVLNLAAGLMTLVGVLLVVIPFGILVLVLVIFLAEIGLILALPIGLVALVAVLLIIGLVQMPIRTYFQYYALLILGDTNPDLDLIPEQREAVRDGGDDPSTPPDTLDGRTEDDEDDRGW